MNLIVLLLTVISQAQGLPLEAWQQATVKVESYPCLTESPKLEGSGLAFKYQGETYIVTSEHVGFHDSSVKSCHVANKMKLHLVKADFFSGMAVLKIVDQNDLKEVAIDWQDLKLSQHSEDLSAVGYPAGSDIVSTLVSGKLLTKKSRRALIAGAEEMIEASRLPVEFGMSGGILLSSVGKNYAWEGVLSHQVLRRESGKSTELVEMDENEANPNDLVLAIKKEDFFVWFEDIINGTESKTWERNLESQISGSSAIQYGQILFSSTNKSDEFGIGGLPEKNKNQSLFVDFCKIVGCNEGADGSGIGGEEDGGQAFQVVSLSLLASEQIKNQSPLPEPMATWYKWLLAGKKVQIIFFRNKGSKRLTRIQSLAQFLTYWQRDGFTPIVLRSSTAEDMGEDVEQMYHQALKVAELAQAARESETVEGKRAWFAMLRDMSLLSSNLMMSSSEVADLLEGENDHYWRIFYEQDFNSAVELEAAFQNLVSMMKKVGL